MVTRKQTAFKRKGLRTRYTLQMFPHPLTLHLDPVNPTRPHLFGYEIIT
jgi:hypothetical protein